MFLNALNTTSLVKLYYQTIIKPFPHVCWLFSKTAELSDCPWLRVDKWLIGSRLMGTLSVPMAALTASAYGMKGLSEAAISVINGQYIGAFDEFINNEIRALKSLALTVGNIFYAIFGIVFGKKVYSAFDFNKIFQIDGKFSLCNNTDNSNFKYHDHLNTKAIEANKTGFEDVHTQKNDSLSQENSKVDSKGSDSEKTENLNKEKEPGIGANISIEQSAKATDANNNRPEVEAQVSAYSPKKPLAIEDFSKVKCIANNPRIVDADMKLKPLLKGKPTLKKILPITFDVIKEQKPQNKLAIKAKEEIQPDKNLNDFFLKELRQADTLNYDYIKKTTINHLFKKPLVLAIKDFDDTDDMDFTDYSPNSNTMIKKPILALTY